MQDVSVHGGRSVPKRAFRHDVPSIAACRQGRAAFGLSALVWLSGDVVNAASRFGEVTKKQGARIVVSAR